VEGGPDSKAISEFNGPVVLRGKVTSTSADGLEATSLFLQGDARVSRKYTVGITEPTLSGNPGDIVYLNNPEKGGYVGWIYTLDNEWYRFGNVSISKDANIGIFDAVGIATNNPGTSKLLVGSGTTQVSVNGNGGVGIGTTANQYKLHVIGDTNLVGNVYGGVYYGDGSGLTGVTVPASGWAQITGGIYNTALNLVGIGTSVPRFNLEVGAVGAGGTSLWVNNTARFNDTLSANNVVIAGIITASSYNLTGGIGIIDAGIVTTNTLVVGSNGATFITNTSNNIGVGTLSPRAKLDVEGLARLKTVNYEIQNLTISSNAVTIDLSIAQNFRLNLSGSVNHFVIRNTPSNVSSFTLHITQNATGDGEVNNFKDFRTLTGGPSSIPVYWPGGGVLPIVTPTANRTDIYTFNTYDGGSSWYAVVVGQNFN
jgi:hypothetical protein